MTDQPTAFTIDRQTGQWLTEGPLEHDAGCVIAASVLPGWTPDLARSLYSAWLRADGHDVGVVFTKGRTVIVDGPDGSLEVRQRDDRLRSERDQLLALRDVILEHQTMHDYDVSDEPTGCSCGFQTDYSDDPSWRSRAEQYADHLAAAIAGVEEPEPEANRAVPNDERDLRAPLDVTSPRGTAIAHRLQAAGWVALDISPTDPITAMFGEMTRVWLWVCPDCSAAVFSPELHLQIRPHGPNPIDGLQP